MVDPELITVPAARVPPDTVTAAIFPESTYVVLGPKVVPDPKVEPDVSVKEV